MTDQELDRWIAENVMGWELYTSVSAFHKPETDTYISVANWDPTTDIARAFEALEKWFCAEQSRRYCIYSPFDHESYVEPCYRVALHEGEDLTTTVTEQTLPLAICRALHAWGTK